MERTATHERTSIDTSNLRLLGQMDDFKVASDSTDVRGWDVLGRDGQKIGKVEHLLVDPGARTVRYLGVDLDRNLRYGMDHGDHVLIPVKDVRLSHDSRRNVHFNRISTETGALPAYDHRSIKSLLHERHDRRGHELTGREGEKRMTLSEEELAVGKRTVPAGGVTIEKKVEKEPVHESVPVSREEVSVERRPATPGTSTAPSIHRDEIRIPLMRQEAVVEKRTMPKEELVVKKDRTEGRQEVDETLRKERAEVHGAGGVKNVR